MIIEIGKITEYESGEGIITTTNEKYRFLKHDLEDNLKVGDLVVFRPEKQSGINCAFFVKNIKYLKTHKNRSKELLKKYIV